MEEMSMEHIGNVIERVTLHNEGPVKTGIAFLDNAIGGYYPGELMTVCGGENSCKSAFVIHQICRFAVDQKIPTLVVLNNMTEQTFLSSMTAYYCGLEVSNINDVLVSEEYKDTVRVFFKKLKESPLFFIPSSCSEDVCVYEMIENVIKREKIKMVFFDEKIDFYDVGRRTAKCNYKTLAAKYNIIVVLICPVWKFRAESVDGIRPTLLDFDHYDGSLGHDVVIAFTNFEQYGVYMSATGHHLQGMIDMKILKCRGRLKKDCFVIHKYCLFFRDYKQRQKRALQSLRNEGGPKIDSLIQKFDLSEEDMPF